MTAVLNITDGTTTVSLVSPDQYGFHLDNWKPTVTDFKNGGNYQDSPLSDGKRLVSGYYDNAIETFELKLVGLGQDDTIMRMRILQGLLKKASDYWTKNTNHTPVWLAVKARDETSYRYAIIIKGLIATEDNPLGMPFLQPQCSRAVMDGLSLVVERGHWCALPPGQAEAQTISLMSTPNPINTAELAHGAFAANTINATVAADGTIYSWASGGRLYRSDDNGTTWVLASTTAGVTIPRWGVSVSPLGTVYVMSHNSNTVIYKSTDRGVTLNAVSTTGVYSGTGGILALNESVILAWWGSGPGASAIRRSTDGGVTWATIYSAAGPEDLYGLVLLRTGTVLISARDATTGCHLYRGTNLGATWTYEQVCYGTNILNDLLETTGGLVVGAWSWGPGGHGAIRVSTDAGYTWNTMTNSAFLTTPLGLTEDQHGYLFTSVSTALLSSVDGIAWNLITGGTSGSWVVTAATGLVLIGETTNVWQINFANTTTTSNTASYIANKFNLADVDSIILDDGGVTTVLSPMTTLPVTLLPAAPAVDDAIYFGCNTAGNNSGPFCSLVFNLSIAAVATTSYTIAWEYYKAATGWSTLTVKDNSAGGAAFGRVGENSVHWVPPTDWTTVTVAGVIGYWVRARVSALTGTLTPPVQQTRAVYTITSPSVDIEDVKGNLPALAALVATVVSDNNGTVADGPDLYSNRIVCGLRDYDRGPNFSAYLNAADEQNSLGVTVTLGTNTSIVTVATDATVVGYVTGKRCLYNPTAAEVMANRVTWALSTLIARDYYGTFHAFMRGQQTGVAAGIGVRLVVTTGSGGLSWTSETKTFANQNDHQLIDFGRITLPVSSLFMLDEIADQTTLTIQASSVSATPNLYIHDLILIPTDEWAGDVSDGVNSAYSAVINDKVLVIDSVFNPRHNLTAKVKSGSKDGLVSAVWQTVNNGPLTLTPNVHQRLWLLSARTYAVSPATLDWRSEPYVAFKLQWYKNERYFSSIGTGLLPTASPTIVSAGIPITSPVAVDAGWSWKFNDNDNSSHALLTWD